MLGRPDALPRHDARGAHRKHELFPYFQRWTGRDRAVYLLRMGGLTFEEIGRELGISRARAHQLFERSDKRIEAVARAREHELWRMSADDWHWRSWVPPFGMAWDDRGGGLPE